MFAALVLLIVVGPMALQAALARTEWRFLPGLLLLIGAFVLFGSIKPVEGDVGGIGAFGNSVMYLTSIGMGIYGLLMLIFTAVFHRKPAQPRPAPLPTATVVGRVTKD